MERSKRNSAFISYLRKFTWVHLLNIGFILVLFLSVAFIMLYDSISGGIPMEDAFINFLIRQNLSPFFFIFSQTISQDTIHGILSFGILLLLYVGIWNFSAVYLHRSFRKFLPVIGFLDILLAIVGVVAALLIATSMLLNSYTSDLFGDPDWNEISIEKNNSRQEKLENEIKISGKTPSSALHQIMTDVKSGKIKLSDLTDDDYIDLAERVCLLIDAKGGVANAKEHYFRNYFDRAPSTLDDMVHTIRSTANEPYHWRLLPIRNTLYHMIGTDGEYNLKFISRDGHFEAVYNLQGKKLSTNLQPWNMGTFNYSSPLDDLAKHTKYDIDPFLKWKNTADSPALPDKIKKISIKQYKKNPEAKKRYKYYAKLCTSQRALH